MGWNQRDDAVPRPAPPGLAAPAPAASACGAPDRPARRAAVREKGLVAYLAGALHASLRREPRCPRWYLVSTRDWAGAQSTWLASIAVRVISSAEQPKHPEVFWNPSRGPGSGLPSPAGPSPWHPKHALRLNRDGDEWSRNLLGQLARDAYLCPPRFCVPDVRNYLATRLLVVYSRLL